MVQAVAVVLHLQVRLYQVVQLINQLNLVNQVIMDLEIQAAAVKLLFQEVLEEVAVAQVQPVHRQQHQAALNKLVLEVLVKHILSQTEQLQFTTQAAVAAEVKLMLVQAAKVAADKVITNLKVYNGEQDQLVLPIVAAAVAAETDYVNPQVEVVKTAVKES